MAKAGASQYTFHIEATINVMDCIQRVKTANMKVGAYLAHYVFLFDCTLCRLILL